MTCVVLFINGALQLNHRDREGRRGGGWIATCHLLMVHSTSNLFSIKIATNIDIQISRVEGVRISEGYK